MSLIDRRYGLSGGVAFKAPCRVATTANITLYGLQSIDGVTVIQDDRVLVKNQSDAKYNGIWNADTGPWTRAADFNGRRDVVEGTMVGVIAGTMAAGTIYQLTTSEPVIGTSNLVFTLMRTFFSAPDYLDIRTYGAVVDGVTDDVEAVQDAIDAAAAAGCGTVVVPANAAIAATVVLRSGVNLLFVGGAKFVWIGPVSGTCVETDPADVVSDCLWSGLTVDTGLSFTGTAFSAHSMHNVFADRITAITTGTTSTAFKLYANSSGGETAATKRNIGVCTFGALVQQGQCGTFLEIGGVNAASGYDGSAQVVTLNTFGALFAANCAAFGINIKQWCDNNTFSGTVRIALNGNNAIGLQVGGTSATDNLGVYMNKFALVAVDTFGSMSGRIGINLERSKLTSISAYYQYPEAEGGRLVAPGYAISYDIKYHDDLTGEVIRYVRKVENGAYNSPLLTVADDAAVAISVADPNNPNQNIFLTAVITASDGNVSGSVWCKVRTAAGTVGAIKMSGGSNFNVVTAGGVLSGTTSLDTKVNVSPADDGNLYIENRSGAAVNVKVTFEGLHQSIA